MPGACHCTAPALSGRAQICPEPYPRPAWSFAGVDPLGPKFGPSGLLQESDSDSDQCDSSPALHLSMHCPAAWDLPLSGPAWSALVCVLSHIFPCSAWLCQAILWYSCRCIHENCYCFLLVLHLTVPFFPTQTSRLSQRGAFLSVMNGC